MNRTRLNWRFLAVFSLLLTLGLGGYFALHARQVRSQAATLPALADRYAVEGKTARALRTLSRYLITNPADAEARLRYARLLLAADPDPAGRAQAAEALAAVLAADPGRADVRAELARALVESARWADARPHLEQLAAGGDPWAVESLGRAYAALNLWAELDRRLTPVCVAAKSPLPADYARLAEARRRLARAAAADEVMDKLVKDHPTAAEAYLIRAGYRTLYAVPGVEADFDQAKRLAPADPTVAVARASRALARRDPAAARRELQDALQAAPTNPKLLRTAAAIESVAGRPAEAVAMIRRAAAAWPQDPEIAVNLVQVLVDAADWPAARTQFEATKGLRGVDANEIEFLSARLTLEAGDWPKAATILEGLRPKFLAAKKPTEPLDALLARCAALAGDADRQLAYARRAAAAEDPAGRLVLAASLAQMGRLDEAADTYRQMLKDPQAPASAAFGLAQLLVIRLGLPGSNAAEADWQEVDRLLDRAATAAPAAWEIPVLRAEALLTRDKPEAASRVLEAARKAQPKEVAVWAASAAAEARNNRLKEADRLLTEGRTQAGDAADLRLTRLRVRFVGEGDKAAALAEAGQGVEALPPDDRLRVWAAQADGYELLDRPAERAAALDRVLAARPNDLRSLLGRFDAAVRLKDDATADRVLAELRRLDGPRGAFAEYVAAYRIVRTVRENAAEKGRLADARRHLAEASTRRPGWAKAALLRAEVEDLEGNADRAAEAFREAFDGGERSFTLLRRLVEYYSERRLFTEADDLIKRIQEKGRLNPAQSRAFAEVYLQAPDYARAVELARQAVADDSRNAADFLWLARVSFAAGRPATEVEGALRKATALAGDTPEPWAALVRYLSGTNRKADAQAVLAQVAKAIAADKVAVILAPCYEAMGEPAQAEAAYLKAVADRPTDLRLTQGAAAFFVRTQNWAKAEGVLRGIVAGKVPAPPADQAAARRELAVVLAALGPARSAEALQLLDQNASGAAVALAADVRARALVLAQRRMTQRAAFDLLDREFDRRPFSGADLFLYAKLAWATDQPAKAGKAMIALLGAEGDNADYLAFWADALTIRGDLLDAQFWLNKLAKIRPDALETARLQAVLVFKQGRKEAAAARLRAVTPRTPFEAGQLAAACEEVEDFTEAERRYRDHLRQVPPAQTAAAGLAVARFLGRRSRYAEALDLADQARRTLPTEAVATVAVYILRSGQEPPAGDQIGRVEGWLTGSPAPKDRPWLPAWLLGELAEVRGDTNRAADFFGEALKLAPAQPFVVESYARLLCLTGGPAEARRAGELVATALAADPANPEDLIEVDGLALLKQGQLAKAIERLRALSPTAPSPRLNLYLTAALLEAGRTEEAVATGVLVRQLGIKKEETGPTELKFSKSVLDKSVKR